MKTATIEILEEGETIFGSRTGGKYFGEIKDGLLNGIGTFYYSNNTKITGNFVKIDPDNLFLTSPEYLEFFLEGQKSQFKVYDEKEKWFYHKHY